MERLLTLVDVAELLGISVRTAKRIAATGDLPAVRLRPGGHPRFKPADVAAYVDTKRETKGSHD